MRFFQVVAGLIMIAAFGMSGCTPPVDPTADLIDIDLKKTKIDDLKRTMGFVFSERRFDQKEFESSVSTGLNRWATYAATSELESVDWQLDPLVEPVMSQHEGLAMLEQTAGTNFLNTDAYYLQQSAWISEVVDRVTKSVSLKPFELFRLAADDYKASADTEDPLVEIVEKLQGNLDADSSIALANSLKYFDWIVRNIQLMPEADPDEAKVDEFRLNDNEDLAAAGVPTTGNTRYPWQTLVHARGDYVDRAKLFMVGLQHLGIDSVMLATKDSNGELTPWVVGAAIGGEYYLFDTKLALPIPGKKLGSIATLSEVRENKNLIDGLDLTVEESLEDDTRYWVNASQLDDLVGLVYVSPESVSKRMKALENQLIGEDRLALVTVPQTIIGRLPAAEGLKIEIWDAAFKTHQFRQAVREALEDRDNDALADRLNWYYQNEAYIDGFTRYRTARARFFNGKFESPRNAMSYNAIESFEKLIYSDSDIERLSVNKPMQRALGIMTNEEQNLQNFRFKLNSVQAQMRLVRRDTGLFLAQSHFDNGSERAALNWLLTLQQKEDTERWKDGITYLLARATESAKEYDVAVERYRNDKSSPQAHGNLIRARLLNQLIEKLVASD